MNTETTTNKSVYLVTYTAQAFQSSIHGVFSIHSSLFGAYSKMKTTALDLIQNGQFSRMEERENQIKIYRECDKSEIILYVEKRNLLV